MANKRSFPQSPLEHAQGQKSRRTAPWVCEGALINATCRQLGLDEDPRDRILYRDRLDCARSSPCAMSQQTFQSIKPFLDIPSIYRLGQTNKLAHTESKRSAFNVKAVADLASRYIWRMNDPENPLNRLNQQQTNAVLEYMYSHEPMWRNLGLNESVIRWIRATPAAMTWITSFDERDKGLGQDSKAKFRAFRQVYDMATAMTGLKLQERKDNAVFVLREILKRAQPRNTSARWKHVLHDIGDLTILGDLVSDPEVFLLVSDYFTSQDDEDMLDMLALVAS